MKRNIYVHVLMNVVSPRNRYVIQHELTEEQVAAALEQIEAGSKLNSYSKRGTPSLILEHPFYYTVLSFVGFVGKSIYLKNR